MNKHKVLQLLKDGYECGHPYFEDRELREEGFTKKERELYFELVQNHSPASFYEEYHSEFDDWDQDFVAEFGYLVEDEKVVEEDEDNEEC